MIRDRGTLAGDRAFQSLGQARGARCTHVPGARPGELHLARRPERPGRDPRSPQRRGDRGHPPHPRRAPRCLTAPQPSVRRWAETGIDQACCTSASPSSDCSGARTGPLANLGSKYLPRRSPAPRSTGAGPIPTRPTTNAGLSTGLPTRPAACPSHPNWSSSSAPISTPSGSAGRPDFQQRPRPPVRASESLTPGPRTRGRSQQSRLTRRLASRWRERPSRPVSRVLR